MSAPAEIADSDDPLPPEAGPRSSSVTMACESFAVDGRQSPRQWHIPEEEPVALVYNRRSFAVMLASPADLLDFGLGFTLAEGIVENLAEIGEVTVERLEAGLAVSMTIPSVRAAALVGRRRAMEGRSGCGICGLENLEAVLAPVGRVAAPTVAPEAIGAALAELSRHQPGRTLNRSVHAAAWAGRDGRIRMAREDVGRHCALDKLIGAMARDGIASEGGFAVLSSRCSLELVQKAARAGIGLLVSVSAPTTLAIATARRAGMVLGAQGEEGEVVIF